MNEADLPSRIPPPIEINQPKARIVNGGAPGVMRAIQSVEFRGPLPPPALLRQYEEICPGYAERIISAFERESAHRRDMEHRTLDATVRHDDKQFEEARRGQFCALTITLAAIGAGVVTAMYGHEIAGSVIGVGGIGGIVGTFILGRAKHKKETSDSDASSQPKNKADIKGANQRSNGKNRTKKT